MDTTQSGVSQTAIADAPTEDTFQSLFDAGAFDSPASGTPAPDAPAAAAEAAEEGVAKPEGKPEAKAAPEEVEYQSLEDYLARNELDPESFRSLPVTVKIDGQSKAVPLADVLKSYQLEGHVNNKSIALSEQQRAFDAERSQVQQHVATQLQQAATLGNLAQQQLMGEYSQINWDGLKAADPAVWAAKQVEFQQRQAAIQQHLSQVQQYQQQQAAQAEQSRAAQLPKEREKLVQYRSEWADQEKFRADQPAALKAARSLGFSDAEIAGLANFDSRIVIAMDMIARFQALQAAAPEAAKRVRAAPPMAKPGVRVNRNPGEAALQQARERLARNPRDEDAQAAVFEFLA